MKNPKISPLLRDIPRDITYPEFAHAVCTIVTNGLPLIKDNELCMEVSRLSKEISNNGSWIRADVFGCYPEYRHKMMACYNLLVAVLEANEM